MLSTSGCFLFRSSSKASKRSSSARHHCDFIITPEERAAMLNSSGCFLSCNPKGSHVSVLCNAPTYFRKTVSQLKSLSATHGGTHLSTIDFLLLTLPF